MKKVLIVNDERMIGGVSVLLEDILNNINKRIKIDLLILHNHGDRLKNLPPNVNVIYGTNFFKVIDLNMKQVLKSKNIFKIIKKIYLVFLLKTGLIKKKIIKERKKITKEVYDVEIAFKDGFCGLFTAYGNSKMKIQWLHSDYGKKDYLEKYRELFKKEFENIDKFIAVSKPVAVNFNKIYKQLKKTIVINNYVDTNKIIERSNEKKVTLSDKKFNFISVGRLHIDKGYDRLLNVINRLKQEQLFNDCHFTLIGNGPEEDNLKELVKKYNLEAEVTLLGKKNNPYPYLKQADLFILSSLHESFGLVVIEALTLKVPVLAMEVATIYEMMDNNIGLIVNNNEEDLYRGLKKIIKDESLILKYKINLEKYVYDNKEIIRLIENLME